MAVFVLNGARLAMTQLYDAGLIHSWMQIAAPLGMAARLMAAALPDWSSELTAGGRA